MMYGVGLTMSIWLSVCCRSQSRVLGGWDNRDIENGKCEESEIGEDYTGETQWGVVKRRKVKLQGINNGLNT